MTGLLTPLTFLDDLEAFFMVGWKKIERAVGDGEELELRIFNRTYRKQPPGNKPWGRMSWQTTDTETTIGSKKDRVKTRTGIIVVEHYFPQAVSQGNALLTKMSMIAEETFEAQSTPGGIWFMRVRSQELAPETHWLRSNTIAEFTYQENV